MCINRSLRCDEAAQENHKQISVPVCSPVAVFSREKLSRSELLGEFSRKSHSGNCECPVHLCPPASVDERADGLVCPRSTSVEVGAVPRLNQAHKVGTFALNRESDKWNSNIPVSSWKLSFERMGWKCMIPPVYPFLSSDIPLFSSQRLASGSVLHKAQPPTPPKKQWMLKDHCTFRFNTTCQIADWI